MTLTLAMIVRDAAAELPGCLQSVKGWVDAVVVADTGSKDRTPALARSLGARVISIPWEDDFACARNLALAEVRSNWVLVLDADERLEGGDRAAWREQLRSGADAFQITIRNYMRSGNARLWDRAAQPNQGGWALTRWPELAQYPSWIEHQNVRLFRRRPELYFVGRVHESVGPRVRAAGLKLAEGRGRIHHLGLAVAPERQAQKNIYYRELGRRKVAEQPQDAQAHFELGLTEFENFHEDARALACFERALRLQPGFGLAWFYGGAALFRLGHAAEALGFLQQALASGYNSPRCHELRGDALYNLGRFQEAAEEYRRLLERGGTDADAMSKLGFAEVRLGKAEVGLQRLRRAVADAPDHEANHQRLVAACVYTEDWNAAGDAQRERLRLFPDHPGGEERLVEILAKAAGAGRR